jgi:hypothetical protein
MSRFKLPAMEAYVLVKYIAAWLGLMVLAVVNGVARDKLYGPRVGELAGHQFSTGILLIAFGAYFHALETLWPLPSTSTAWAIGVIWLAMTLLFETALGRLVAKQPWRALLADYNLLAGRLWILVPLWVLCGPYVALRFARMG